MHEFFSSFDSSPVCFLASRVLSRWDWQEIIFQAFPKSPFILGKYFLESCETDTNYFLLLVCFRLPHLLSRQACLENFHKNLITRSVLETVFFSFPAKHGMLDPTEKATNYAGGWKENSGLVRRFDMTFSLFSWDLTFLVVHNNIKIYKKQFLNIYLIL